MSRALLVVQKFFPKVEIVVDAVCPALIEVTAKDANSKAVMDHVACAMAVACKRKFHLDGVLIARSIAYLVKGKRARRFFVPPSVSREVTSFDRGAAFMPGKYMLSAICKTARLGADRGRNKPTGPHSNSKPIFRHVTSKIRTTLSGEDAD